MPIKPSKKELEARVAELEALLATQATKSEATATVQGVDLGTLAHETKVSSIKKQLDKENTDIRYYEVQLLLSMTISADVTDRNGNKKSVLWEKRGDVQLLTADQIQEVSEYRDLFYDGILSAPEVIPPSQNVIIDYDAYINDATMDNVHERIAAIDSSPVLMNLYHYIENHRLNAKGESQALSPKQSLVLLAVMNRLNSLVGFNFSATDVE